MKKILWVAFCVFVMTLPLQEKLLKIGAVITIIGLCIILYIMLLSISNEIF